MSRGASVKSSPWEARFHVGTVVWCCPLSAVRNEFPNVWACFLCVCVWCVMGWVGRGEGNLSRSSWRLTHFFPAVFPSRGTGVCCHPRKNQCVWQSWVPLYFSLQGSLCSSLEVLNYTRRSQRCPCFQNFTFSSTSQHSHCSERSHFSVIFSLSANLGSRLPIAVTKVSHSAVLQILCCIAPYTSSGTLLPESHDASFQIPTPSPRPVPSPVYIQSISTYQVHFHLLPTRICLVSALCTAKRRERKSQTHYF